MLDTTWLEVLTEQLFLSATTLEIRKLWMLATEGVRLNPCEMIPGKDVRFQVLNFYRGTSRLDNQFSVIFVWLTLVKEKERFCMVCMWYT